LGYPPLNGTLMTDPYVTVNSMPKDGTPLDCGTISPANCRPALAAYIVANFVGKANIPITITNPLRRLSKVEYINSLTDLFPNVILPSLSFPTEDNVFSFYNNWERQAPSTLLIDALYHNANNLVNTLSDANLNSIIPCTTRDTACATSFIQQFGRRVYRHPVSTTEVNQILTNFYSNATDDATFKAATKLSLKYFLMNAEFLYRPEFGSGNSLTAYEKAARISFFIWQSTPDDTLLDAAQNGTLDSQNGLEQQVDRLLADPRAQRGVREFFGSWLDVNKIDSIIKATQYDITSVQKASLKESILQFVWLELFKKNLPLTELLTTNTFYVDSNIASFFGVTAGSQLQAQTLSSSQRTGILTHPGILASYGHGTYPSPVLRGVFVMDRIMCAPPNPPPAGVNTSPPAPIVGTPQTNRELYLDATTYKGALCASCHNVINPLGFSMEMFDTQGVFRSTDNGFALDTSGQSFGFDFDNVFELSASIASSSRYQNCVVKKMLSFGVGGWNMVDDTTMRTNIIEASNGLLTRDMFKAVAMHPNFSQYFYPIR
jgi:Protein of unknown function (DUF1592)/Protein of unknown function (DUF1588)/Protein of unknown function (DUF1595)/Protein of unknown function (DUF1587)